MSIQQLAEQSNKEDAVLTEAMADVLLRQGKAAVWRRFPFTLILKETKAELTHRGDQVREHMAKRRAARRSRR